MIKKNFKVLGVMSGTSLDGIDMVCVTLTLDTHWKFKIHKATTVEYSKKWLTILKILTLKTKAELEVIDKAYTHYLAEVINQFITDNTLKDIDFIASHGHTALHNPKAGFTYQIGNLQALSNYTNHNVVCDFRAQDVALGGQGAPLVPIGDQLLFGNYTYCLNLGGFANISFKNNETVTAFDICPVNIVLNHYVNPLGLQFDDGGKLAASATPNSEVLQKLNTLDFYKQAPPKSLGLEWVSANIFPLIDGYGLPVITILATVVEHAAMQIGRFLNTENTTVLITGGGAYNTYLIQRITYHSKSTVVIPNKHIIEYKEALIFGLLGVLKLRNEVNCLASVTGAAHNHSSGKIIKPYSHK